jgi:hypothetical protein
MPSRERTAFLLRDQAGYCAAMGSPLYAHLLERAAADALAGGPVFKLLEPFDAPSFRADALALRLMASVHRLVLSGHAPRLAPYYPTVGGSAGPDGVEAFRALVADEAPRLASLVALPCQTNEVGRCAALAFGFLELAAAHTHPLRLLEVGASAGLNLRFDRFRYGGGGASFGSTESPVDLSGLWLEAPARLPAQLGVVERRGCDLNPVDPTTPEGRLTLEASLWADRSCASAACVAPEVAARAGDGRLRVGRRMAAGMQWASPGQASPASSTTDRGRVPAARSPLTSRDAARAGAQATNEAPLAWLRLEPTPANRGYAVTLTSWPGGEECVVATAGAHGTEVRRPLSPT